MRRLSVGCDVFNTCAARPKLPSSQIRRKERSVPESIAFPFPAIHNLNYNDKRIVATA
jgi:hypothetical protein